MLRVTAICVLLCMTGTVWSEEGGTTFDEAGATGRGPRVVDHGAQSQCKQEKSWGICADEDWGSKCPSGCRMQGLADQKDKEFGKRMDAVRKALVDNQNTYKSADLTTKETYNLIKENLVAGQSGEGLYNQVSEDLRRRISVLKIKVVNQLNTIKSLENSIRQQVQSMKRLEVDIDIKIRACKGSCSKGVVYNVDTSSYENMQKQLLQSSTIHLQPDTNEVPMLKMRLLKDDKPTHFKALTWDKFGDGQYNMFSDIEQRQMVIEKRQEVIGTGVGTVPLGSGPAPDKTTIIHTGSKDVSSGKNIEATGGGSKSTTIVTREGRVIQCTKTITKKTVYGPDGPREEITESITGGQGDECSKLSSSGGDGKGFVLTGGDKSTTSTVTTQGRVISCTKTISKKIVHGPGGPTEVVTESFSGGEGDECSKLGSLGIGEKGVGGGTVNVKVTSGNGFTDLSSFPSLDEFFQSGTGTKVQTGSSKSSGSSSSHTKDGSSSTSTKVIHSTHDVFSDLGEDETDDFSNLHLGVPSFPDSSSSHTKTVVVSSGDTKEGSPFEVKMMKSALVFEDLGPIQHDESGEDNPDLQARSVKKEAVNLQGDYVGTDCADIQQKHSSGAKSGKFTIRPEGSTKVLSVYCDQDTNLGGWLLVQQRKDGSINFNRTWHDYKEGFSNVDGNGSGECWLGNEYLHLLTQRDTILRVELEDWSGAEAYAEYTVQVGPESEGYALKVSHYDGTAGDPLIEGSPEDSEYTSHANMKFSTLDRDNDRWEESCAEMYGGGWWYNNCQAANLNGIYYVGGQYDPRNNVPYEIENGVVWSTFRPIDYSLKVARMKIRPAETL
ncbi:fibrinogen alpha chain [Pleurodeles waltl]|uniref:fibrinogen alpha chain n=1 Tax=Pleurodeles waltl TaxID=8319 RepID=UPI00370949E9